MPECTSKVPMHGFAVLVSPSHMSILRGEVCTWADCDPLDKIQKPYVAQSNQNKGLVNISYWQPGFQPTLRDEKAFKKNGVCEVQNPTNKIRCLTFLVSPELQNICRNKKPNPYDQTEIRCNTLPPIPCLQGFHPKTFVADKE